MEGHPCYKIRQNWYNVITSGQIQNDNINLMITIIKQ